MKAVILAAGMGTRLRPMTENLPKCLIEINGKSLLEYSLDNLAANGIKETIIVTGYLENVIKVKIGNSYRGMNIQYIWNGRYSGTGSMYSLSCIKDFINEDIMLLESDLFYEKRAIACLLESGHADTILTSDLLNNGDDVFICTAGDNRITNLGKRIPDEQAKSIEGCLVGISRFSHAFLVRLFEKAEQEYAKGIMNDHYEECVMKTSLVGTPVYALHCNDLVWTEIDNENDYRLARELVLPEMSVL